MVTKTLGESFIVIGAGVLFIGFSGSRWTKFFTERYLSYVASVGVKLFVLYLIMGVGITLAGRWSVILEQPASPMPFLYVAGGALVFVFVTWHIPSVAAALIAGTVQLSLADMQRSAMAAAHPGVAAASAVFRRGGNGAMGPAHTSSTVGGGATASASNGVHPGAGAGAKAAGVAAAASVAHTTAAARREPTGQLALPAPQTRLALPAPSGNGTSSASTIPPP